MANLNIDRFKFRDRVMKKSRLVARFLGRKYRYAGRRSEKWIDIISTLVLFCCVIFLGYSCTEPIAEDSDTHSVSGTVYYAGSPSIGVQVSLDQSLSHITVTDQSGYFRLDNVPEGSHEIRLSKLFEGGSYTSRSETIVVATDVYLSYLMLPKAVFLQEITTTTHNSVEISWTSTDATDFREYKLYHHTTSGLDENTGLLVHVSTAVDDTFFVDEGLIPDQQYFYRVYVMNEYGRLGGSNIISTTTTQFNLIKNGDFENFNLNTFRPDDWDVYLSAGQFPFLVDSVDVKSGRYCLKAELDTSNNFDNMLFQLISPIDLIPGRKYEFSLFFRSNALIQWQDLRATLHDTNWDDWLFNALILKGPGVNPDWQLYAIQFMVPLSFPSIQYRLTFNFWTEQQQMTVWLDNISLMTID